jgi:hypothetical protein
MRQEHKLRVFENRVLTAISGPKRGEATSDWRKIHNVELYDLYSSPNTIRVTKSRWGGGAGGTYGGLERCIVFGGGKLKEGDHMEGTGGRILLKWMFKK